jgi:hypothetical protein
MSNTVNRPLADYAAAAMATPCPPGAVALGEALSARFANSSVLLYGSGISAAAKENPADILYDFYVIAPDYRSALPRALERIAARALPPNVYYFEADTPIGRLRCKYALLSIDHFEKLVSPQTFHSYFWARFAQPCRIVVGSGLDARIAAAVAVALERFLATAAPLAGDALDWRAVWLSGLKASYRAELRAESGGRAEALLTHYGDWPGATHALARIKMRGAGATRLAWRARQFFGAALSVARLLKATATFDGGIDYIAWKIKRHTGVDVAVKPWERRHPFIAAPIVARRYYRMRAARTNGAQ